MIDMPENPTKPNPIYSMYMYQEDLALDNLQWLISHKTQLNQTKPWTFQLRLVVANPCFSYFKRFSDQT